MTKTAVDETASDLRRERLARRLNALMGVLVVGLYLGLDLLSGATPGFGPVQATLLFAPMFSATCRLHPEYPHTLVPGADRITTRLPAKGGQRVRTVVNSRGYRRPEISRPRGGYRVVVYGDSFVEARFSEHENSFPAQLRRQLSGALAAAADRHDIRHVDLFPHFASRGPNTVYFHGLDNHWNDRGRSLAAEIVAAYVVEQRFPPTVSDWG